jgi:hypothetical protein
MDVLDIHLDEAQAKTDTNDEISPLIFGSTPGSNFTFQMPMALTMGNLPHSPAQNLKWPKGHSDTPLAPNSVASALLSFFIAENAVIDVTVWEMVTNIAPLHTF